MLERTTIYGNKVYLKNVMADGVVIEDMEDFRLPYCKETKSIYITIANIAKSVAKRQAEQQAIINDKQNED